jgi:predicted metal-dependent peptidase
MEKKMTYSEQDVRKSVMAAKMRAYKEWPYQRKAIASLMLRITPGIGTCAVDQWFRLYVDPEMFMALPIEQKAGVLAHEAWHPTLLHGYRRGNRDPKLWNIACDLFINSMIGRRFLPEWGVFPDKYNLPPGKAAEWYYTQLVDQQQEEGEGPSESKPGVTDGDCGSGATGVPEDYEDGPPTKDKPGVSKHETKTIERQVAKDVKDEASKSTGNVPGALKKWSEETLAPPRIPWSTHLRGLLGRVISWVAGQDEATYRTLSRRMDPAGRIINPAFYNNQPSACIILDTSASMNREQVAASLAEGQGIIRALRVPCDVVAWDSASQGVEKVRNIQNLDFGRGGGTNMADAIEWVGNNIDPDVIILFTDGYTPWPSVPPHQKLIVVMVGKDASRSTPSWMDTIYVDDQP